MVSNYSRNLNKFEMIFLKLKNVLLCGLSELEASICSQNHISYFDSQGNNIKAAGFCFEF